MRSRKHIFVKSFYFLSNSSFQNFIFKSISRNKHLDDFFRYFSFFYYNKSTNALSFATRLKLVCWSSGKSRGLLNSFYISRQTFKEYAIEGRLFGYKRSRW